MKHGCDGMSADPNFSQTCVCNHCEVWCSQLGNHFQALTHKNLRQRERPDQIRILFTSTPSLLPQFFPTLVLFCFPAYILNFFGLTFHILPQPTAEIFHRAGPCNIRSNLQLRILPSASWYFFIFLLQLSLPTLLPFLSGTFPSSSVRIRRNILHVLSCPSCTGSSALPTRSSAHCPSTSYTRPESLHLGPLSSLCHAPSTSPACASASSARLTCRPVSSS